MHLVFHSAALGDFVLMLPLLRRLRGDVTLVCDWQRGELAEKLLADRDGALACLDDSMIEFTRLFVEGGPSAVSPMVREAFEAAESVISFVADEGSVWADNVRRLCPGATLVFAPTRPAAGDGGGDGGGDGAGEVGGDGEGDSDGHITARMASAVVAGGVELAGPRARDALSEGDFDARAIGAWLVHPGSGGAAKCWPMARWVEAVGRLREAGGSVRVICGHVEMETWSAEDKQRLAEVDAELVPHLPGLAALLEQHREAGGGYVGVDSGPTHLAAATGLATVALFGPSDPRLWRPMGERVRVVAPAQPEAMDWLSVDRVVDELMRE